MIILICFTLAGCEQNMPFEKDVWLSNDLESLTQRKFMLDDLRTNYIESGMSDNDVLSILGKPDVHDTRTPPYSFGYGYKREGVKCWALLFEFDDDSLITETKLITYKHYAPTVTRDF